MNRPAGPGDRPTAPPPERDSPTPAPPRRIVVKGAPGAGKSTLAAELARRLGLAHVELDALHHGPGWTAPPPEAFRERVRATLDAAPGGWVVDGNDDSKLGDLVVAQADTVVWLDLPLRHTRWRLWRRTTGRIRAGAERWNGNRETWCGALGGGDALLPWAIRAHRRHRREWPRRFAGDPRLVRLRSDDEVRRWLAAMTGA